MSNPFEVGGSSNSWNYSDNTKDNYSEQLGGQVVEIRYVQALDFQTKQPKFWPDGNPQTNFRIIVLSGGHEFAWTISTAAKSAAIQAIGTALGVQPGNKINVGDLLGKNVVITTKPGSYNSNRPRPWWVQIQGDGDPAMVRGLVNELQERAAQMRQAQANQYQQQQQGAAMAAAAMQPPAPAPAPAPAPVQQVAAGVPVPADAYATEDIPF